MLIFHDLLTQRQANPCSDVLGSGMETLKDQENTREMFGVNANPIVLHREDPFRSMPRHGNMNLWWVSTMEFDRIADQVLKELRKQSCIPAHTGQGIVGKTDVLLRDRRAKLCLRMRE